LDYDWITPRIALGALIESKYDAHELIVQGVSHVVNMCMGKHDDPYFTGTDVALAYYGIFDGENEEGVGVSRIRSAIDFISEAIDKHPQHKVYVHCAAGISRSAAVMVGYLMRTEEMTMSQALRHVREIRPCVNPHPAHLISLLEIFQGEAQA
jgi:hypothetical protein